MSSDGISKCFGRILWGPDGGYTRALGLRKGSCVLRACSERLLSRVVRLGSKGAVGCSEMVLEGFEGVPKGPFGARMRLRQSIRGHSQWCRTL